ncbi:MAG: tRNA pseudouridine(38-40) synthase TruA [Lachnospiraceae bacterium]|nr:tRNA pseudouridine(38-40) synthase TruA [Lachnospiraceae bacterium]
MNDKKRIKLVVAYDGTNYCGWQIQTNGPTIEEELNKALTHLLGEEIHVIGASRTDAGVHSLGNVCVFDTETNIPAEKICYAVNMGLPEDIAVQESCEVDPGWHPRKCESTKTYEYRILNRPIPLPTRRADTYFYYGDLDIEAMRKAAKLMEGTHDFASFCSSGSAAESTVRTVYSCEILTDGDLITVRVSGSGFLYNMVRIMVGTLLLVGSGQLAPEDIPRIIEARDRSGAGPTAPAKGLTMIGISFEK